MLQILNVRRRNYLLFLLGPMCFLSVVYYTFSFFLISTSVKEKPIIIYWPKLRKNLGCYYSVKDDALQSAEDPNYSPGDKAIFFHETSCRGGINSRQACAIESAARLHPQWQINVLFSAPVTEYMLRKSNLALLLQLSNVRFARVHIEEYGKGTVIEQVLSHQLKESSHPVEHAADILRVLTLNKFGGVYLDTDSFLIQNLDSLRPNWIAKESQTEIASGAMSFSKDEVGFNVTRDILLELNRTFSPTSWSDNGPRAIHRVLDRICPGLLKAEGDCGGVIIFAPEFFYPIHYSWHQVYFKNGSIASQEGPYMHHMWNYMTKDLIIEDDSPFAKLARKFCPSIYEMYGEQFGE